MDKMLFLMILGAVVIAPEAALAGMSGMGGMGSLHSAPTVVAVQAIPEPTAFVLFASSMAITAGYFRTLRNSSKQ